MTESFLPKWTLGKTCFVLGVVRGCATGMSRDVHNVAMLLDRLSKLGNILI